MVAARSTCPIASVEAATQLLGSISSECDSPPQPRAAVVAAPLAAQPIGSLAPLAGSTTLNFNLLTAGTVLSNQYPGVTISNGVCANSDYPVYFGGDRMQLTNFLAYTSQPCNGVQGRPITFTFATAINSFGFLGVTNGGAVHFTTRNGATSQPDGFNGSASFYGITDVTPFSSIQISVAGDGYIILDDVSFITTTPEPTSLALVAVGLLSAIGYARRRRARSA